MTYPDDPRARLVYHTYRLERSRARIAEAKEAVKRERQAIEAALTGLHGIKIGDRVRHPTRTGVFVLDRVDLFESKRLPRDHPDRWRFSSAKGRRIRKDGQPSNTQPIYIGHYSELTLAGDEKSEQ